jgi:hypothetical protein
MIVLQHRQQREEDQEYRDPNTNYSIDHFKKCSAHDFLAVDHILEAITKRT